MLQQALIIEAAFPGDEMPVVVVVIEVLLSLFVVVLGHGLVPGIPDYGEQIFLVVEHFITAL